MSENSLLQTLIAGQLKQNFIISPAGEIYSDIPGGSLVFSAVGYALWETGNVGLIARVGENFPRQWIDAFDELQFDKRGIAILPKAIDTRQFWAYDEQGYAQNTNPVPHYAKLGVHLPKALLGYAPPFQEMDSRTRPGDSALQIKDIPNDYFDASSAHICPLDFHSHKRLLALFSQNRFTTLTLDPAESYMHPVFWEELPGLLNGLTAFHTSEEKLQALFHYRSTDLWEMASEIAQFGCEIVVIKRKARGQLVYNHANHERWSIPAYPSRVVDPTGAGDAFGGGFLAGFRKSYDPVESALYGNISASIVIEGGDPFYALDAMPGLAQARLDSLRSMLRKA